MWLDEAKAALRPPEQAAPTQPPPESEPEPVICPKNPQEVGWFHFAQNTLTMAGLDLPTIRNLEIGAGTDNNLDIVNRHYQAFSSRHPSEPYEPKVPRARSSLPRNKRTRKRVLFRKLQRKWKHNRSEACSEAVAGKWDPSIDPGTTTQDEPLDMEALEAFWRPLFEKESVPDSRAPEATRDPNWNVVNPISTSEVKWAIKNSKRKTSLTWSWW